MPATANYQRWVSANIISRCLHLAKSYLIVPDRLHRWCTIVVACAIAVLIGCFITYAYVEKFNITSNFFYGRVKFSFVDRGYPELFGYTLEVIASILFMVFALVHQRKCWYAWSAIMFVIFLDDALKLHETIGQMLSAGLGLAPVAGDLIGFASTGLISGIFWIIGLRKLVDEVDLSAYLLFTVYFTLLIFFGVGVDAIHGIIGKNMSQTLFTLVEDGSELLITAIIALSALGMWARQEMRAHQK